MDRKQISDFGQAAINLGVAIVFTGTFGSLIQPGLKVPYYIIAPLGLVEGGLFIYIGLMLRKE